MNKILQILLILIFSIISFTSCTIENRLYFPGYYTKWNKSKTLPCNNIKTNKDFLSVFSYVASDSLIITSKNSDDQIDDNLIASIDNSSPVFSLNKVSYSLNNNNDKEEQIIKQQGSNDVITDSCDVIILINGDEISGKILEIGIEEIKYKKCDNLNGPTIIVKKSDVYRIKYINGTQDEFTTEYYSKNYLPTINNERTVKKAEAFGIISFIFSILGIFLFGIPFGLLAVVFGGISMARVSSNYGKYSGTALGVIGFILGAADFIIVLVILSSMY